MENSKAIDALNDLITKNYDAERGYQEAAEDVDDILLKSYFHQRARNRYDFGHDLKDEIRTLGGKPEKGTSVAGDLHRVWMDIKSSFTSQDEVAILNECKRGEEYAIEEYEEALKNNELPISARTLISSQLNKIRSTVRGLESKITRYEVVA
ncbi:MAG: PA2169 family four-helix-bundle protein [Saprospiraceae bacterium]